MSWDITGEARAAALETLVGPLASVDLQPLNVALMPGPGYLTDVGQRERYAETLNELHDLLEEYRFEASFGTMVLVDFWTAVSEGRAEANGPTDERGLGAGWPVESLALMAPFDGRCLTRHACSMAVSADQRAPGLGDVVRGAAARLRSLSGRRRARQNGRPAVDEGGLTASSVQGREGLLSLLHRRVDATAGGPPLGARPDGTSSGGSSTMSFSVS
jgi:hypothetical protein